MRIFVNGRPLKLLPGMTVKHALIQAGLLAQVLADQKVYDEWGHEVGLDGALAPEMKLYVTGNGGDHGRD